MLSPVLCCLPASFVDTNKTLLLLCLTAAVMEISEGVGVGGVSSFFFFPLERRTNNSRKAKHGMQIGLDSYVKYRLSEKFAENTAGEREGHLTFLSFVFPSAVSVSFIHSLVVGEFRSFPSPSSSAP